MNIRDIAILLVVTSVFLTGFMSFYSEGFSVYGVTPAETDLNSSSALVIETMQNFSEDMSDTIQEDDSFNIDAATPFAVFKQSFSVVIGVIQQIPNTFQTLSTVLVNSLPPVIRVPVQNILLPGIMAIILLYIGFELLAPFIGFKTR